MTPGAVAPGVISVVRVGASDRAELDDRQKCDQLDRGGAQCLRPGDDKGLWNVACSITGKGPASVVISTTDEDASDLSECACPFGKELMVGLLQLNNTLFLTTVQDKYK